MTRIEVICRHAHNTASYGMVQNDTEEYYSSRNECSDRANQLRNRTDIAYVLEGYWCPASCYRVAYAYKA